MIKTVWIVKGVVTSLEAWPDAKLGDAEWQFSDGMPGERGSSDDYLDLEKGLRDFSGYRIIYVGEEETRVRTEDQYQVLGEGAVVLATKNSRVDAENWAENYLASEDAGGWNWLTLVGPDVGDDCVIWSRDDEEGDS